MEKKLRNEIKNAMILKNKENTMENLNRYQTLKNILEKALKDAKDNKIEKLTDSMIIDAAKKEIKQQKDFLGYLKENDSRAEEVKYCISVAEEFLPKMATEEEIKIFVENNKNSANNIGTMMKLLKVEFGDSLDGKMASQIVKKIL